MGLLFLCGNRIPSRGSPIAPDAPFGCAGGNRIADGDNPIRGVVNPIGTLATPIPGVARRIADGINRIVDAHHRGAMRPVGRTAHAARCRLALIGEPLSNERPEATGHLPVAIEASHA